MADPNDPNAGLSGIINSPLAQLLIPAAATAAAAISPRYGAPAATVGLGALGAIQRGQINSQEQRMNAMRLKDLERATSEKEQGDKEFDAYASGLGGQPDPSAPAGGNAPAVGMASASTNLEHGQVDAPHDQSVNMDTVRLAKMAWHSGDHATAAALLQKARRHPYDAARLNEIVKGIPKGGKIETNFGDEENPIKYTYENKVEEPKMHFETVDNGKTKTIIRYDERNPADRGTVMTSTPIDKSGVESAHLQVGDNGNIHAFIVNKSGGVTHVDTGVKAKGDSMYRELGNKLILAQQGRPTGDPQFDAAFGPVNDSQAAGPFSTGGPFGGGGADVSLAHRKAAESLLENMNKFLIHGVGDASQGAPAAIVPGQ